MRAVVLGLVVACAGSHTPAAGDLLRLRTDGTIAAMAGDVVTCITKLERAAELDPRSIGDAYDAAACHARKGELDAAFRGLDRAIARGLHALEELEADPDFAPLHRDARWPGVAQRVKQQLAVHLTRVNVELHQIVSEDQKARTGDFMSGDIQEFAARDAARLVRVKAIIAAGGAKVSDDYYNAALVAQHGETPDDYRMARTLALKAVELDPENREALWLAAAATDRELVNLGKPQRFGTQSMAGDDHIFKMRPVDPAVSDAERARWNVRSLADQQHLLDAMNKGK
ncbi:MAG: hypothetical protein ABI867_01875 [Kofleriaceae bacterium]